MYYKFYFPFLDEVEGGVSSLTTNIGVIPDPESFFVVLRRSKFWLGEDLVPVVFVVIPVEFLINFLDASFILALHRTMYMKIHNPEEQLKTICRYSKIWIVVQSFGICTHTPMIQPMPNKKYKMTKLRIQLLAFL